MQHVIIMRGLPGSGKSHVARLLAHEFGRRSRICSADHYFTDPKTGEYNFDGSKMGDAHLDCLNRYEAALLQGIEHVFVDNTNTQHWEYAAYFQLARRYSAAVHYVTLDISPMRCLERQTHGVPEFHLGRMSERFNAELRVLRALQGVGEYHIAKDLDEEGIASLVRDMKASVEKIAK